jgi:hypothetical protein
MLKLLLRKRVTLPYMPSNFCIETRLKHIQKKFYGEPPWSVEDREEMEAALEGFCWLNALIEGYFTNSRNSSILASLQIHARE